jgi:hypothetical protein
MSPGVRFESTHSYNGHVPFLAAPGEERLGVGFGDAALFEHVSLRLGYLLYLEPYKRCNVARAAVVFGQVPCLVRLANLVWIRGGEAILHTLVALHQRYQKRAALR